MNLILFILVLGLGSEVRANPVNAFWLNNHATRLLQNGRNFEASQELIEGLAHAPFNLEIHMNLGLAFERQKEFDKALSEYQTVFEQAQDLELKFAASFNAARVLAEQKKIKEALSAYQSALTIHPDSKEVKTNIELLMAQSGGGGGQGNEDKSKSDQQGQGDKDPKDPKDGEKKQKPDGSGDQHKETKPQASKPKEFQSNNMSQSDVRKILEELKNQEQKIRRKEYDKKAKEVQHGKDW